MNVLHLFKISAFIQKSIFSCKKIKVSFLTNFPFSDMLQEPTVNKWTLDGLGRAKMSTLESSNPKMADRVIYELLFSLTASPEICQAGSI